MTNSYKSDKDSLRQSTTSIKSDFAKYGLDSSPLTELMGICGWLDDQMPMLTRRYHLSIAASQPYEGFKGMVSIDESMVGQTAQSQKDGKALADKYNDKIDNGDPIPEDLFADLEAHKDDADYLKSFYEQLGPQRLAAISSDMASNPYDDRYKDHPDQLSHDRDVIAGTLGTFTQVEFEGMSAQDKQAGWNKWFDNFKDARDIFRPDQLTPLLQGGTFDKDFLVALGDRVFAKDPKYNENEWMQAGDKGPWGSDHYTQLFDAISKNPEASGEWMDHNYDAVQIIIYPHGPWNLDEPKERAAAFMKLMHSATIDLRTTNEPLAEKLVGHLMLDNYAHQNGDAKSIHPVEGVDYLYSQIVTAYWNDLENGITSPTADKFWMGDATSGGFNEKASKWDEKAFLAGQDPSRFGLEASGPMWQALLNESARDPKAAGEESALFDAYRNRLDQQIVHSNRSDTAAQDYLAMRRGMMMKAYGTAFTSAKSSIEGDAQAWADGVNAFRKAAIEKAAGLATAAATGGGTAVADLGKEELGGLGSTATGLLTDWIAESVSVKPEEAPGGLADKYKKLSDSELDTSWRDEYRRLANLQLSNGFDDDITKPVTVGPVHQDGKVYTGDPKGYITGPADNFLEKDGSVTDVEKMSPQQMAAYSRWLQDPAVVAKIENDGFQAGEQFQHLPDD